MIKPFRAKKLPELEVVVIFNLIIHVYNTSIKITKSYNYILLPRLTELFKTDVALSCTHRFLILKNINTKYSSANSRHI